jgi:hypothetical protein
MEKLITLVYLSNAAYGFTEQDLKDILSVSRANNSKIGLSGVLIYCDGNILQVLEGPEEHVMNLYNKIEKDPRHTGLIMLQNREITVRSFDEWSMGFRSSSKGEFEEIEGYLDLRTQLENNKGDGMNQVKTLMTDFIKNNR